MKEENYIRYIKARAQAMLGAVHYLFDTFAAAMISGGGVDEVAADCSAVQAVSDLVQHIP